MVTDNYAALPQDTLSGMDTGENKVVARRAWCRQSHGGVNNTASDYATVSGEGTLDDKSRTVTTDQMRAQDVRLNSAVCECLQPGLGPRVVVGW